MLKLPGQQHMMESSNLVVFTSDDLKSFTETFHEKNLIGTTQFGRLFRGRIQPQGPDVTVKIWDEQSSCISLVSDEYLMVKEEVKFLTHPTMNGHPNLVKLIGVCCEKEVRDDLNWIQRVNIMLQLASLIEYLHTQDKPYMILNISGSHILLDWDCKPKLCDFGLISGGTMGEINTLKKQIPMPIGYADPFSATRVGYRQTSSDVFSFGVILLGLISRRVLDLEKVNRPEFVIDSLVHCWARNEYRPNCSLAHKSLVEDWGYNSEDGTTITEIGIRCTEFFPKNRPTMKGVVERLKSLLVFQRVGDTRPNKREKKFLVDHAMIM
ncbi:hypothetical protein TIFTF001_018414 [Ficus carica]|uniref:Protein kinase domain-containing protein n=1 Tax=Ficus carica TaxID=3494 RepID=A0AA88ANA4_FICCA|nr:hypothetical protein TIFTF001_018414 [Ficus carica]